jgi:hypothetical protein
MPWIVLAFVVLGVVACNRSPSGSGGGAQQRPPHPTAPSDWTRRHGYDTGAPSLQQREEAGQPAASSAAAERKQ